MNSNGTSIDRLPPQAVDVERAVLGACLIDRHAVSAVADILSESDFYHGAHRKLYAAVLGMLRENIPVDQITLSDRLERLGILEEIGGRLAVAQIAGEVGTSANVEYHAGLVKGKASTRELINLTSQIQSECYANGRSVGEILSEFQGRIFDLDRAINPAHARPLEEIMHDVFDFAQAAQKKEGTLGIATGFRELDELTLGLHKGELSILASWPGHGKTSCALQISRNAAVNQKTPVLFFSLEMQDIPLGIRLICAEARIDSHRFRSGRLSDEEWMRMTAWSGKLIEAPIWIDDASSLSVLEMMSRAKRFQAEHGLGLVVVDYLQIVRPRARGETREREVAGIAEDLKVLAKSLDVPVLVCAQLNEDAKHRGGDKRPSLGDIRESRATGAVADLVMFIYQPRLLGVKDEDGGDQEGYAEIIVGKQRNGPVGSVPLTWLPEYGRFEEPEMYREEPF